MKAKLGKMGGGDAMLFIQNALSTLLQVRFDEILTHSVLCM